jgi:glucosamine--fructose-6-phosphate aminotransferase (isomerizing)
MSVPTTDSFMYQTMHRQPDDLRRLTSEGWALAREAAERLAEARRVFVVGIGTSYHAALMGGWLLRAAGSDARAVSSFDFAHYPESFGLRADDAVIVMAHSGVKTFSSRSLQVAAGADATVISVGSLTAEHPGSQLVLRTVEREKSAAFTASHTAAMTVLAQVATELGEARGAEGIAGFRAGLEALPDQVAGVLAREEEVQPISQLAVDRRIYASGAGPNEIAAIEAVIKVREAAYGWIDALAIEQFLHGPIVAVNDGDLNVVVNVPGSVAAGRVGEIVATLHALGSHLWLVGQGVDAVPEATVFALPHVDELLSPILATVPMQILAYQLAVLKGINPDTFRRDNPVFAAAIGLLKL